MANQGPWGGGGDNNRPEGGNNGRPPRRPGNDGPQIPEIDEIVKKGQEQLRVLMGGRGRTGGGGGGGGGGPVGPVVTRQGFALAAVLWLAYGLYTGYARFLPAADRAWQLAVHASALWSVPLFISAIVWAASIAMGWVMRLLQREGEDGARSR